MLEQCNYSDIACTSLAARWPIDIHLPPIIGAWRLRTGKPSTTAGAKSLQFRPAMHRGSAAIGQYCMSLADSRGILSRLMVTRAIPARAKPGRPTLRTPTGLIPKTNTGPGYATCLFQRLIPIFLWLCTGDSVHVIGGQIYKHPEHFRLRLTDLNPNLRYHCRPMVDRRISSLPIETADMRYPPRAPLLHHRSKGRRQHQRCSRPRNR